MRRYLSALALAFVTSTASSQPQPVDPALTAVDACVARLDRAVDIGYARIAARCPGLTHSLEQTGWAAWLPRGWKEPRNDLSAGSLEELRTLVARELATPPGVRHPRADRLKQVLTDLGPAAQQRGGFWQRFRTWLRTVFAQNERPDGENWLGRLIHRNGRSQTAMDLLTYGALTSVVALAVAIVWHELRAAGLVGSRSRALRGGVVSGPRRTPPLSWRDVERAALAEKPRLLLELLLAKLAEHRRMPPAGALTAREVTRVVELPDAADRERLQEVVLTAERARYAKGGVAEESVRAAVERGRQLIEKLEGT